MLKTDKLISVALIGSRFMKDRLLEITKNIKVRRLEGILQPNFSKMFTTFSCKILLQLHWECLLCLDILVLNTACQPGTETPYLQVYTKEEN